MKKFKAKIYGSITLAVNTLTLEKYIEDYQIEKDFIEVSIDVFRVRIISPIDDALQFTLYDLSDNVIQSVLTESVTEALPIRRVILSLFGLILLRSFKTEWDGYTVKECQNEN